MLVLEGPQGILKSSALATLCHDDSWFLEDLRDINGKDALMQFGGKWLVEIAELQSFRGAESARLKAFISTRTDNFRPPYARVAKTSPAQSCSPAPSTRTNTSKTSPAAGASGASSAAPSTSTAWPRLATNYGPRPPRPSAGESWWLDDPKPSKTPK